MPRKNTSKSKPVIRHHNTIEGFRNSIGSRIKELRRKASPKVSQEDLAGRLAAQGILLNRTAIAKIESRKRAISDFEIIAIAKALRISPADLITVTPKK